MIKNERQYKITKSKIREFEETLRGLVDSPQRDADLDPRLQKSQIATIRSVLADLRAEVIEYETLKSGKFDIDLLDTVEALPVMLIKARIAVGWTHKELARKLKLKEPQIQNYEATNYARASLARVAQIAGLLKSAQRKALAAGAQASQDETSAR